VVCPIVAWQFTFTRPVAMVAIVMLMLNFFVFEGASARIKGDGLTQYVDKLAAANKKEQCNVLKTHEPDFDAEDDISMFFFGMFSKARETPIDDVLVLRCLADSLHKNLNITDKYSKQTLLFPAVYFNRVDSVQYLVDYGVPLEIINSDGLTAAQLAVDHCSSCLSIFLRKGVNANGPPYYRQRCKRKRQIDGCRDGWRLAHFAVADNNSESLRILSEHSADLNAQDSMGMSPAHTAVIYKMRQMLIELGQFRYPRQ